jgi:hypothetical protein
MITKGKKEEDEKCNVKRYSRALSVPSGESRDVFSVRAPAR